MDQDASTPKLVPELDVVELESSIAFYALLGFEAQYARPEEGFVYLACPEVHLMLQTADGPGRQFRTADLEHPHGRGVNFQLEVQDVTATHGAIVGSGRSLVVDLGERWYAVDDRERGNRQLVVADPDGYFWRPFQNIGDRPRRPDADAAAAAAES